jgi:hypothetical protein
MSVPLYFTIIGNNNKCITGINNSSILIDTPNNDEDCMKFNYTRNNMIINNNKCLTKNFKLGTENCLQIDYYSNGVIKQNNICYNNNTGKPQECTKTFDNYMKIQMNRLYD